MGAGKCCSVPKMGTPPDVYRKGLCVRPCLPACAHVCVCLCARVYVQGIALFSRCLKDFSPNF